MQSPQSPLSLPAVRTSKVSHLINGEDTTQNEVGLTVHRRRKDKAGAIADFDVIAIVLVPEPVRLVVLRSAWRCADGDARAGPKVRRRHSHQHVNHGGLADVGVPHRPHRARDALHCRECGAPIVHHLLRLEICIRFSERKLLQPPNETRPIEEHRGLPPLR